MTLKRTDDQLWAALAKLDEDVLDRALPNEQVDQALRDEGLAPEKVRATGAAFIAQLLDGARLGWMTSAATAQAAMKARAVRTGRFAGLGRDELLAQLGAKQRRAPSEGAVAVMFRKRKPEESSDDDLRELLEDIEIAESLGGVDADGDD